MRRNCQRPLTAAGGRSAGKYLVRAPLETSGNSDLLSRGMTESLSTAYAVQDLGCHSIFVGVGRYASVQFDI